METITIEFKGSMLDVDYLYQPAEPKLGVYPSYTIIDVTHCSESILELVEDYESEIIDAVIKQENE